MTSGWTPAWLSLAKPRRSFMNLLRSEVRYRQPAMRGFLAGSLVVAAVSLPLVPDDAAAACADRDLPFEANPVLVRAAMVCEIAAVRARRDARPLRPAAQLELAAGSYATDMFERRYFSHVSPDGGELVDRVRRSGFAAP